jgi:hypothetical protein
LGRGDPFRVQTLLVVGVVKVEGSKCTYQRLFSPGSLLPSLALKLSRHPVERRLVVQVVLHPLIQRGQTVEATELNREPRVDTNFLIPVNLHIPPRDPFSQFPEREKKLDF